MFTDDHLASLTREERARLAHRLAELAAAEQASTAQASTAQASTARAATGQAATERAIGEGAIAEGAIAAQATAERAGTRQAATQAAVTRPATTQVAGTRPATTQAAGTRPAGTERAAAKPAGTEGAAAKPAAPRAHPAADGRPAPGATRRRWLAVLALAASAAMIPWTARLATTLPERYVTQHWSITWVGFDSVLVLSFAVTAWATLRRSRAVWAATAVTATLLLCDAWFDITTASTAADRTASAIAGAAEVPLAALLLYLARHPSGTGTRPPHPPPPNPFVRHPGG